MDGGRQEASQHLFCVLGTLRLDVTGLGDPAQTVKTAPRWPSWSDGLTPNLDRLGEESAVFTHAYAAAPWTVPSHASMFTGKLPTTHGCVALYPRLGAVGPTLADLMKRVGYHTAAFFSNP